MICEDVIAAIASPIGACARIVIRVSGAGTRELVGRLAEDPFPEQLAARVWLRVEGMRSLGLLLLYEQGHGYTGEESAELHLPGNPLLAQLVLQQLYRLGARPAEPGEFTARAFFNGRLDLTEAEGVAATIHASNQRELDAARRLGAGELTARLRPMMGSLTQTLALVEAGIDFSEEDVRFISAEQMQESARAAIAHLEALLAASGRFERLSHEPLVVLCGKPNAGKSTLLNALAGRQRAVVSPAAGTTRDLLTAEVQLPRGVVRLVDCAGLEASPAGESAISTQMQQRARKAVEEADVLVLVCEAGDAELRELSRRPDMVVETKADLAGGRRGGSLSVSALTGEGMPLLRDRLNELAFAGAGNEMLALNARHVRQIRLAIDELGALMSKQLSEELAAEHLRAAADALGEITGMVSTDDLLGRIFSSFCIGK